MRRTKRSTTLEKYDTKAPVAVELVNAVGSTSNTNGGVTDHAPSSRRFLSAPISSSSADDDGEAAALSVLRDHGPGGDGSFDPRAPLNVCGMNALHVSAGRCAIMVLQELLSNDNYGMDVNSPDGDGNTALHHASSSSPNNGRGDGGSSSLDAVRILVEEYGADVLRRNGAGRTPYDAASTQAVRDYLLHRQLQAENPAVIIVAGKAGDFVNGGGDFVRGGRPPHRKAEATSALQQCDDLEEELEARLRNLRRSGA